MNGSVHSLDDIFMGLTYMGMGLAAYCIYIPCLIVMRSDDLKTNTCFQIMFHLGIADLLHLTAFITAGFWTLTGLGYRIPYWLNKFVGAVCIEMGWRTYLLFVNLLAFNRFLIFSVNEVRYEKLFSKIGTKIWISACWLLGLAWMAVHLTPGTSMVYTAETFSFFWDFSRPWTAVVVRMSWWTCTISQCMIIMWYVIAIISLKMEFNDMSVETRRKQRSLMTLAIVIGVTLVLSDQYWHSVVDLVCPILPEYCLAIGGILMIVNNGINPVCYITMNKRIRTKVFKLVGLNKNQEASAPMANKWAAPKQPK